jgi:hypothetical protein
MEHLNNILYKRFSSRGIYLDEEELGEISTELIQSYKDEQNFGIMWERTKTNNREAAFSEEWYEHNKIKTFMNWGYGALQDLFIDRDKMDRKIFIYEITKNDRVIVATVIQWLGTNIGFSFLERALKRCGYEIVKIKNQQ